MKIVTTFRGYASSSTKNQRLAVSRLIVWMAKSSAIALRVDPERDQPDKVGASRLC
jgi:hypothetical protein